MRVSLLHTARGQASIALAGVLLLSCAAMWNSFQDAREYARDRAVLALVARQRHLAHDLSVNDPHVAPQARLSQLAAGDANLQLMLALAAPGYVSADLRASLAVTRQEWAAFRRTVMNPAADGRQMRYIRLIQRLDTLAKRPKPRLTAEVRAEASRQALTLAGAAPLLAWAFIAVSRAAASLPEETEPLAECASARTLRTQARFQWPDGGHQTTAGQGRPRATHAYTGARLAGAPDLAHELRAYAADFRQIAGIVVELALDERAAAAVPTSARTQALTIAREAITDTRRDTRATHISIALWQDPGAVWLAIVDNGIRAAHNSMAITRARAERIGGELRVSTQPDGGTMILARLPLRDPAEAYDVTPVGAPRRAW